MLANDFERQEGRAIFGADSVVVGVVAFSILTVQELRRRRKLMIVIARTLLV